MWSSDKRVWISEGLLYVCIMTNSQMTTDYIHNCTALIPLAMVLTMIYILMFSCFLYGRCIIVDHAYVAGGGSENLILLEEQLLVVPSWYSLDAAWKLEGIPG